MEGVKLVSQCKLCLLLKQNEDLWIETHKRVIEDELNYSIVCRWLNSQVDFLNEDLEEKLPKFNTSNFALHFTKHVSDKNLLHGHLKKHLYSGGRKGSTIFSDKDAAMAEALVYQSPRQAEHERLTRMVNLMEANLLKYSQQIEEASNPTKGQMESFNKFVIDLITTKQHLDKLRDRDKQASQAVHSAIELVVRTMADKAVSVADDVEDAIKIEVKGTTLAERISKLIKSRFSADLRDLIHKVSDTVYKEYGIR